jgi:hypothetical protein
MAEQTMPLYHVTERANVALILRDGFNASEARKSALGIETYRYPSGVWLADVPPITVLSVDQWTGHADEGWIEVIATAEFYYQHMLGNEWNDASWPTRQWPVSDIGVNALVRREVDLVEVLRMRLANGTTEHHTYYTADVLNNLIRSEMGGDVQRRWQAALDGAVSTTCPAVTKKQLEAVLATAQEFNSLKSELIASLGGQDHVAGTVH